MQSLASSAQPPRPRRALARPWPLLLALLVTLVGFLGADAIASRHLRRMTPALQDVSTNASASVIELGRVMAGVIELQRDAHVAIDEGRRLPQLDADMAALEDDMRSYVETPLYAGEARLRAAAVAEMDAVRDDVATLALELERGHLAAAHAAYDGSLAPHLTYAADRLSDLVSLNATGGAESAAAARARGEQARVLEYALDAANAALLVGLALVAIRATNRYRRASEGRARELEAFAARVAHDLRGPLTPAALALDRAACCAELPGPLRAAVDRGRRGIARTSSLVEALLEFARAGGRPESDARADVREAMGAAIEENLSLAESAGVSLSMDAREPSGSVRCAPGVLSSITSNLVRNAVKHMGDSRERRVAVRVARRGRCVRVEVADTGPGVPAGMERAVFEPYVRASSAEGIGLGLATVKRLVEAHGGSVGVRSSPAGATFWFELPTCGVNDT